MWHKYPNPKCSHVVSIDVLDRSVDPTTGIIRTERIMACKQKAPGWIVKVSSALKDSPGALLTGFTAIWRLGRCICSRNIIHRPTKSPRLDTIRQHVAIPVRHLCRAHRIHTRLACPNLFCPDSGGTGTHGFMADCSGWAGAMDGAAVRAERAPRQTRLYRRITAAVGRASAVISRRRIEGVCRRDA